MRTIAVEKATKGGPAVLIGRPSDSRVAWETARAADAADLNQLLAAGGTVEAYVVPLWSNADAERCLRDLRGFDDARVYVVPAPGADGDAVFAAVAEADWVGVSSPPFAPARGGGGGGERRPSRPLSTPPRALTFRSCFPISMPNSP